MPDENQATRPCDKYGQRDPSGTKCGNCDRQLRKHTVAALLTGGYSIFSPEQTANLVTIVDAVANADPMEDIGEGQESCIFCSGSGPIGRGGYHVRTCVVFLAEELAIVLSQLVRVPGEGPVSRIVS